MKSYAFTIIALACSWCAYAQQGIFGDVRKQLTVNSSFISIETDPVFWPATLPNGPGLDLNIDARVAGAPRLRFGILVYTGRWANSFSRSLLLTDDFPEDKWEIQWNGMGAEGQYQFRFGLARGGLQPGLRIQWNQFEYIIDNEGLARANHLVLTPQLGFQWFPFRYSGLYLLPWAGAQLPIAGTDQVTIYPEMPRRDSRKLLFIVTAHVGWEFKLPQRAK